MYYNNVIDQHHTENNYKKMLGNSILCQRKAYHKGCNFSDSILSKFMRSSSLELRRKTLLITAFCFTWTLLICDVCY